jgi:hypothetical protein
LLRNSDYCDTTGILARDLTLASGRPNLYACESAFTALRPLLLASSMCGLAMQLLVLLTAAAVLRLPDEDHNAATDRRRRRRSRIHVAV